MEDKEHYIWFRCVVLGGELLCLTFMIWLTMYQNDFVTRSHVLMYRRMTVILGLCYVLANLQSGMVLHRRIVRGDQILFRTLRSNLFFCVASILVLFILDSQLFSWRVLPFLYGGQFILSLSYRYIVRKTVKFYRSKSNHRKHVLFVGDITNCSQLYARMASDRSTGYKVLGYFSDVVPEQPQDDFVFLGTLIDCEQYLKKNGQSIDNLYCTLPENNQELIRKIVRICDRNMIHMSIVPSTYSFLNRRTSSLTLAGVHMLRLNRSPLEYMDNRIIKRVFDIVFSGLFLCTIFPFIYAIFGILIKLSSPGPVLFKQKRSGLNGKEFMCLKFRSMAVNKDADKLQATKDDPRKTRIGEFMRKTNIDELPQFINVFLGDMSVVGPRPHMTLHTDEYSKRISKYMVRHFVKPGVTGLAQVTGFRGETKELWQMEGRVKQDIWYMEHWTFTLDLWIIIRTLINTGEKNAY